MITRTSRGTKRFAAAAAVALVGSTLALTSTASAGPGAAAPDAARVEGADRYATAVAAAGTPGANDITIVNGLNFPDGLSAAAYGERILLTEADELPAATAAFLGDAGFSGSVRIVGGTLAVSSLQKEAIEALIGAPVERVAGENRYATALAVALDIADTDGSGVVDGADADLETLVIATGQNFPDALAAGPLVIESGGVLLLNDGEALSAENRAFITQAIDDGGGEKVYIVGGESAVPASVETELTGPLGLTVERLAGANRDETAVAIAAEIAADFQPLYLEGVTAVNGTGFADALSAGPLAARNNDPILTVRLDSIPGATAAWHVANCSTIEDIIAVGGTAVISADVVTGAVAAATCNGPQIESATLTIDDEVQRVIAVTDVNQEALTLTNTPVTLTAVADGAADVLLGNDWSIDFVDTAVVADQGATIDLDPDADAMTNDPEITFGADFTAGLTRAEFVTAWNASDAGAIFTAAPGSTTVGDGDPFTAEPGDVDDAATTPADAAEAEVDASVDVTVVVTFDRLIDDGAGDTPTGDIYIDINPASAAPIAGLTAGDVDNVTPATADFPAAGITSATYEWEDAAVTPGDNGSIRFAIGDVRDLNNNFTNPAQLIGAL